MPSLVDAHNLGRTAGNRKPVQHKECWLGIWNTNLAPTTPNGHQLGIQNTSAAHKAQALHGSQCESCF
jgi:hypothetical protein